jgi:sarcosine oxidase subunit beta
MAQAIATGTVPGIIAPFGLDRFATMDLINEMGATAASH